MMARITHNASIVELQLDTSLERAAIEAPSIDIKIAVALYNADPNKVSC
jgi:hypothetical protein